MADPDTDRQQETGESVESAGQALLRQRRKALIWAIVVGTGVLLVVALINPNLALLAGGMLVMLGTFGAVVSWAARWLDRQLK